MKTRLMTFVAAAVLIPGMALAAPYGTKMNGSYIVDTKATTVSDQGPVDAIPRGRIHHKGIKGVLDSIAPSDNTVGETVNTRLNSDTSFDANKPFTNVKGTDLDKSTLKMKRDGRLIRVKE